MAAKNSLTAADAARVEAAFHSRLSTLQTDNEDAHAGRALSRHDWPRRCAFIFKRCVLRTVFNSEWDSTLAPRCTLSKAMTTLKDDLSFNE